jgi:hypothetical protein
MVMKRRQREQAQEVVSFGQKGAQVADNPSSLKEYACHSQMRLSWPMKNFFDIHVMFDTLLINFETFLHHFFKPLWDSTFGKVIAPREEHIFSALPCHVRIMRHRATLRQASGGGKNMAI